MVEVILTSKIEGLGAEADIVRVRPGYARNFLIPRKMAAPATGMFKRQIETLQRRRAEREAQELNEANTLATQLNKMTLTFQMTQAEGSDKVFGSVTAQDITDRLAKQNIQIERRRLKLPHPLKELGEHRVEINIHPAVEASIRVVLDAPKVDAAPVEEAPKKGRPRKPPGKS